MTMETYFLSPYLKSIPYQTNKYWFSFSVPNGAAKFTSQVKFKSESPIVAYQQHDQNRCCFSSLDYALKLSKTIAAEISISTHISTSLTYAIHERI